MSVITLTLFILLGSFFAGLLGSLTGLGGGFIIVPLLTLALNVDIHYAIGASLISVIATSSGSAAAFIKEGITNIRLGIFLEVATTLGAVTGAILAMYVPTHIIAVLFGLILISSAAFSLRKVQKSNGESSPFAEKMRLNGSYPSPQGAVQYGVTRVGGGFSLMMFAGVVSGLLGVGSGALKVLAMDTVMRIPFKVSTTTSNFMIGVTAAASAVVYMQRGYIDPGLCMPLVIGVLAGAITGSRILVKTQSSKWLRVVFVAVVSVLAVQMIYNGIKGEI
jgi:uncharacterized protein